MRRITLSDMDHGRVLGILDAARQHALGDAREHASNDEERQRSIVTANSIHELMVKMNTAEAI